MNEHFYQDIMVQTYRNDNYSDPTKLFIILSLTAEKKLKPVYSLYEIAKYVYRLYISNLSLTNNNFNIVIRNIEKYGISDIVPIVYLVCTQWIREQKNDSLKVTNENLYVRLDDYSDQSLNVIRTICNALLQKYYKCSINEMFSYEEVKLIDDRDIDLFGKSSIKKLIFEELQYCPLCENIVYDDLYVTHILFNDETQDDNDSINPNNLLLMCRDEWIDYEKGLFVFDEFGKVVNKGSMLVNNRMRLSQRLLNSERKAYIIKHYELSK